jgi:hypothetical protein
VKYGEQETLRVQELLLRRGNSRRLTWFFYKTGDHLNTSYLKHQATVALRKLTDRRASDVMIRLGTATTTGGLKASRDRMQEVLEPWLPALIQELP